MRQDKEYVKPLLDVIAAADTRFDLRYWYSEKDVKNNVITFRSDIFPTTDYNEAYEFELELDIWSTDPAKVRSVAAAIYNAVRRYDNTHPITDTQYFQLVVERIPQFTDMPQEADTKLHRKHITIRGTIFELEVSG